MPFARKLHSTRCHLSLLAALAIGLFAAITTQASAQTFETSGGILDGVDGVVVDGSNYNVAFVPGSCVSVFNGCTSNSDFTFQTSGGASDASAALASILSGGIVNPSFFPNGIVNESQFGLSSAHDILNTPLVVAGGALEDYAAYVHGGGAYTSFFIVGSSFTFAQNSGEVYAVWTPTSVPEPGTLFLFGAGLLGLGALRRRRSVKRA